MGVLTTTYSIPPDRMKKLRAHRGHLEKVFRAEPEWSFARYDLDETWDGKIRIIGKCYPSTRDRLNHQTYLGNAACDVWVVPPKDVQFAAKDLAGATFEGLLKWCNLLRRDGQREYVADANGKAIPEELFSYYVGDLEDFKAFLREAADGGHFLLFATS